MSKNFTDITILTSKQLDEPHVDDLLLTKALEGEGLRVALCNWEDLLDRDIEKSTSSLIFRSTWGYHQDLKNFKKFLKELSKTKLSIWNSLPLIRWNLDKKYLLELQARGIAIVPTKITDLRPSINLSDVLESLDAESFVIKPTVGANAYNTFRVELGDSLEHLNKSLQPLMNQKALIQSFIPSVISEGEYSLVFFEGVFSHSILKTSPSQDFRVQNGELHKTPTPPNALRAAQNILKVLDEEPLYARIDLVRSKSDKFLLMELELIEPQLFLEHETTAASVFAQVISKNL